MKAVKHLGPFALYTAYIFVAGSVKSSAPPGGMSDKLAHGIGFGLMVPLALLGLRYLAPRWSFVARVAAAVAVSSGVGALLEVWQLFLSWRSCELYDWAADTVGAIGVGCIALLFQRASQRGSHDSIEDA